MKKRILACDLSLTCPAFAVLEVNTSDKSINLLAVTHIKTNSKKSLGYRLFQISNHLTELLHNFSVDEVVVEKGFSRFAVATQQLQRVVGVTIFTIYGKGYESIHEIAPTSVKKAITGNGKASKDELAKSLYRWVGYADYKTDDESDAVGVGVAFAMQKGWV